MKKSGHKLLAVFLLAGAAVVVASVCIWNGALSSGSDDGRASSSSQTVVRPIPTAVVKQLAVSDVRTFPGNVRANRRVDLAFSVPGLLEELNAQEGRTMRKGEVLARLDRRDYQYALDSAGAKYSDARLALERARSLRDKNAVPQAEYDKAEAAHEVARAEWHIRQKALEDTILYAPFDGVVAKRYVENCEHVQARKAILSFQDISMIEVVIQVPERLMAQDGAAGLGNLRVRLDADRDRWFDASIREWSVQSDTFTQTYDVVVGLKPPAGIRVFPGMTATVKAETGSRLEKAEAVAHSTLVPTEAVWADSDGRLYVWGIEPQGGAPRKIPVRVGALRDSGIEIVSGLVAGQHVAVAGTHTLREKMLVRPMEEGKEGLDG